MPVCVCRAFNIYKQVCAYVCMHMHVYNHIHIYMYALRNVPFEKEKMAYCFFQRGTAPSWRTIRKCDSLHFWRNCSDLLRKNPYNKGETMSAHTYLLYMYVYVYIHIFIYIYNTYLVNACSKYACTYKCKTNTIIRHTHTHIQEAQPSSKIFIAILVADLNRNSPTGNKTSLVFN